LIVEEMIKAFPHQQGSDYKVDLTDGIRFKFLKMDGHCVVHQIRSQFLLFVMKQQQRMV